MQHDSFCKIQYCLSLIQQCNPEHNSKHYPNSRKSFASHYRSLCAWAHPIYLLFFFKSRIVTRHILASSKIASLVLFLAFPRIQTENYYMIAYMEEVPFVCWSLLFKQKRGMKYAIEYSSRCLPLY